VLKIPPICEHVYNPEFPPLIYCEKKRLTYIRRFKYKMNITAMAIQVNTSHRIMYERIKAAYMMAAMVFYNEVEGDRPDVYRGIRYPIQRGKVMTPKSISKVLNTEICTVEQSFERYGVSCTVLMDQHEKYLLRHDNRAYEFRVIKPIFYRLNSVPFREFTASTG
jgi:hypothetical protein